MNNHIKVNQNEIENINLRSEEVTEIMGSIPNRLIRHGIGIIFFILISLIVFSFYFKYPEIIHGQFYIQTINPPAFMLSPTNGKVENLLINNEDSVQKGDLLVMIENSTDINSYLQLKEFLNTASNLFDSLSIPPIIDNLGSLQQSYSQTILSFNNYYNFITIDYHNKKTALLEKKIIEIKEQISIKKKQVEAAQYNYNIAQKQFIRDSLLYLEKTISTSAYQNAQKAQANERMSLNNMFLDLSNSQIVLSEMQTQIIELHLQREQEKSSLRVAIKQSIEIVKGNLSEWEKRYCIISPIDGKIALSGIWVENQNVKSGQLVLTVIPANKSHLIGKIMIPIHRAGKINSGQSVNLKFADFPYKEFGVVKSQINNISEIHDSSYIGTILLGDSLVSSYGITLPFKQNMQGNAEIITDDITLAEQLIYPIKSIFKQHIE